MIHTCEYSCAACVEQYRRDNAGRCAAVLPQSMTWTCERCGRIGYVGNETHRCEARGALGKPSPSIEDLIARSSLGTPEAVAIRSSAPRAVVEEVLRRVDEDRYKGKS